MRLSYRLVRQKAGFLAECLESNAMGEGSTEQAAIDSLRKELEERMFRPDAVAPPSDPPDSVIELVRVEETHERHSIDLGGPGDAPLRG
jgi:hypothetical protein